MARTHRPNSACHIPGSRQRSHDFPDLRSQDRAIVLQCPRQVRRPGEASPSLSQDLFTALRRQVRPSRLKGRVLRCSLRLDGAGSLLLLHDALALGLLLIAERLQLSRCFPAPLLDLAHKDRCRAVCLPIGQVIQGHTDHARRGFRQEPQSDRSSHAHFSDSVQEQNLFRSQIVF